LIIPQINAAVARVNKNGTTDFISVQLKKLKTLPILVKLILLQTSGFCMPVFTYILPVVPPGQSASPGHIALTVEKGGIVTEKTKSIESDKNTVIVLFTIFIKYIMSCF
jgi:hypothetical protein